ncbi:hypothetical protein TeGR_g3586 [Tetraparma gracilis]|uniref:alpha-1,3-mannosyl-glycoprotein 2-beta-N-acetylglucosaminyltransferase n=1 Tax=Tetraparma gracilis TaxID=2962635 RepID=A0ABQ6NBS8_9STRA|nr:hypothetical protein TeGR_g3586 [Tetraparma gracilis]
MYKTPVKGKRNSGRPLSLSSLTISQVSALILTGLALVTFHQVTHLSVHPDSSSSSSSLRGSDSSLQSRIDLNKHEISSLHSTLLSLREDADAPVDLAQWQDAVKERDEIITGLQIADAERKAALAQLHAVVDQKKKPKKKVAQPAAVAQAAAPLPVQAPPAAALPVQPSPNGAASSWASSTALLIFTYKRADYLTRTLDKIATVIPPGMSVVISQDGEPGAADVASVIATYKSKFGERNPVTHVKHTQKQGENGYQLLSQHYGFGLENAFAPAGTSRVIVLEEDIDVAPDFFKFFERLSPYLDDPNEDLLCISAWNDNGMRGYVSDEKKIVRSDFFPGLGWMLSRPTYEGLLPWPRGYWDDWMREPPQRRGREILRPEISRTFHFGQKGGTSGNIYSSYLDSIQLNVADVDWAQEDVGYLERDVYDARFKQRVLSAQVVDAGSAKQRAGSNGDVLVEYRGLSNGGSCFERVAKQLGIMDNIKANVPRTAYKGVVEFAWNGGYIFVAPPVAEISW